MFEKKKKVKGLGLCPILERQAYKWEHISRVIRVPMRNCQCHLINYLHFPYCLGGVFFSTPITVFPDPPSEGEGEVGTH